MTDNLRSRIAQTVVSSRGGEESKSADEKDEASISDVPLLLSVDGKILFLVDRNGDGDDFLCDTFVHSAIWHGFSCFVVVFHLEDCSSWGRGRGNLWVSGVSVVHGMGGSVIGVHGYGCVRWLVRTS